MATEKRGVVLVGHGGIPKDCPQDLVTRLKRLEAQRRTAKVPPSPEEIALEAKIRRWPRTTESDPYWSGLEILANTLRPQFSNDLFAIAYNEFCAPTLEEAVEELISQGATKIVITTTMFTPGGSHSEVEIPETLDRIRTKHPTIELRYAWPFDLQRIADTLAEQIRRFF